MKFRVGCGENAIYFGGIGTRPITENERGKIEKIDSQESTPLLKVLAQTAGRISAVLKSRIARSLNLLRPHLPINLLVREQRIDSHSRSSWFLTGLCRHRSTSTLSLIKSRTDSSSRCSSI